MEQVCYCIGVVTPPDMTTKLKMQDQLRAILEIITLITTDGDEAEIQAKIAALNAVAIERGMGANYFHRLANDMVGEG